MKVEMQYKGWRRTFYSWSIQRRERWIYTGEAEKQGRTCSRNVFTGSPIVNERWKKNFKELIFGSFLLSLSLYLSIVPSTSCFNYVTILQSPSLFQLQLFFLFLYNLFRPLKVFGQIKIKTVFQPLKYYKPHWVKCSFLAVQTSMMESSDISPDVALYLQAPNHRFQLGCYLLPLAYCLPHWTNFYLIFRKIRIQVQFIEKISRYCNFNYEMSLILRG